jgi:hypothetical protein
VENQPKRLSMNNLHGEFALNSLGLVVLNQAQLCYFPRPHSCNNGCFRVHDMSILSIRRLLAKTPLPPPFQSRVNQVWSGLIKANQVKKSP